ncbi:putative 2-(5''-triphosphoribosyl)-3'-dephosphocoenzyme-A synthase [Acrocarpospora phusangensis]|uniref:triphosphoribosyl-dephospho-CoA synthase n=1 Tax=Acrocarpospora phusangensis TaxID=1070424 RepID=A0A919UJ12_9ACTN|nr:triphosphoribosyl-dephospho-CoA synthase [Acrocarpospora phusangensis]GIH23311.1 putative 2-(5''-triphosphoribosyl)-3'-dephosphocoenzyme-A synthase [Acrocarpospora phusangensis]
MIAAGLPAGGRTSDGIADVAVRALRGEAWLTPKPGLVDCRGGGSHDDMDLPLLLASAESLRSTFRRIAEVAGRSAVGVSLREELGRLGRAGDRAMLRVTGGVNTHRGALWAVGLLVAAVAGGAGDEREAARAAARLAVLPDLRIPVGDSHGRQVWLRYGVAGARGEAEAAFPHVIEVALPRLRRARADGLGEAVARVDALLEVMSLLADTCVLHRGGHEGLRAVRRGAGRVLAEGGSGTGSGLAALAELDELLRRRRLSPGGSADLLAAALFLDMVPWGSPRAGPEVFACRR